MIHRHDELARGSTRHGNFEHFAKGFWREEEFLIHQDGFNRFTFDQFLDLEQIFHGFGRTCLDAKEAVRRTEADKAFT